MPALMRHEQELQERQQKATSRLFYATPAVNMKKLSSGAGFEKAYKSYVVAFFFLRSCWDSCQVDHFKIILRQFACQREEAFSEPTLKSILLLSTLCKGHV